mmetsp:Transcript_71383/g.204794  ORF Transcript_71383/g.204794 Transcript_71383/m.204794 type:complete len:365 (-) Transcript_71383:1842-2936(-)
MPPDLRLFASNSQQVEQLAALRGRRRDFWRILHQQVRGRNWQRLGAASEEVGRLHNRLRRLRHRHRRCDGRRRRWCGQWRGGHGGRCGSRGAGATCSALQQELLEALGRELLDLLHDVHVGQGLFLRVVHGRGRARRVLCLEGLLRRQGQLEVREEVRVLGGARQRISHRLVDLGKVSLPRLDHVGKTAGAIRPGEECGLRQAVGLHEHFQSALAIVEEEEAEDGNVGDAAFRGQLCGRSELDPVAGGRGHQEERAEVLGLTEAALRQAEVALLQRHVAELLPLAARRDGLVRLLADVDDDVRGHLQLAELGRELEFVLVVLGNLQRLRRVALVLQEACHAVVQGLRQLREEALGGREVLLHNG